MRVALLLALAACGPSAAPTPTPTPTPTPAPAPIDAHRGDDHAAQFLHAAGARGAVLVTDVETGEVVASAGAGRDVAAPVLPLSVIKLYVAALRPDRGGRPRAPPARCPCSAGGRGEAAAPAPDLRATSGKLRAEATIVHGGKRIGTAEARLVGADGKLYATATASCLVTRRA